MSATVSDLPVDLLPTAGGTSVASKRTAPAEARRLAWAREMERAQCDEWFKRSEEGGSTSMPSPPRDLAAMAAALAVQPGGPGAAPSGETVELDWVVATGDASAARDGGSQPMPHDTEHVLGGHRLVQTESSVRVVAPESAQVPGSAAASAPSRLPVPGTLEVPPVDERDAGACAANAARSRPAVPTLSAAQPPRVLPTLQMPPLQAVSVAPAAPAPTPGAEHRPLKLSAPSLATERPALASRATAPIAPIRMHVEWQGDTAHIWLGLDPTFNHHLPELVQTLSAWLRRQGLQLRGLVCNGQAVVASAGSAAPPRHATGAAIDKKLFTSIDIVAERDS